MQARWAHWVAGVGINACEGADSGVVPSGTQIVQACVGVVFFAYVTEIVVGCAGAGN